MYSVRYDLGARQTSFEPTVEEILLYPAFPPSISRVAEPGLRSSREAALVAFDGRLEALEPPAGAVAQAALEIEPQVPAVVCSRQWFLHVFLGGCGISSCTAVLIEIKGY